jgi:hypothetical protein
MSQIDDDEIECCSCGVVWEPDGITECCPICGSSQIGVEMDEMFNWCCLGEMANGKKTIKAFSLSRMARTLVANRGCGLRQALQRIALTFFQKPELITEATEFVIIDDTASEWPRGLPE